MPISSGDKYAAALSRIRSDPNGLGHSSPLERTTCVQLQLPQHVIVRMVGIKHYQRFSFANHFEYFIRNGLIYG